MRVCLKACRVLVIEHDRVSRGVIADANISSTEGEAIMSNALTEEFGIAILNPKKGLWRFRMILQVRLGAHRDLNSGDI